MLAPMSYVLPGEQRPVSYTFKPPAAITWESTTYDLREVAIHDARQNEQEPQLEREGFELWDALTCVKNFWGHEEVRSGAKEDADTAHGVWSPLIGGLLLSHLMDSPSKSKAVLRDTSDFVLKAVQK